MRGGSVIAPLISIFLNKQFIYTVIRTKKMKKIILLLLVAFGAQVASAQISRLKDETEDRFNFYIINDSGRNGYYEQKSIAEKMGEVAEEVDIEFIVSAGDLHHFDGIASVNDPLWMTNFELIYSHPELMIQWYGILGNHEWQGNTEAFFDYGQVSRRWGATEHYYTQLWETEDGGTVRIVYIDTAPLINKYRYEEEKYSNVKAQDMDKQLKWIDSVLKDNKADWTVVVGHHPIYADTKKNPTERTDLQARLDPILRKHNVDFYICGHIHNFQHIKKEGTDIEYIVNGSASLARDVKPIDGTQFCSNQAGFSIFSADKNDAKMIFIDQSGNVLNTVRKAK